MNEFERFESRKTPTDRVAFKTLISAKLTELACMRLDYIAGVPAESQVQAESTPVVRTLDARMSYLRELAGGIARHEGRFDSSERIVEDINDDLVKLRVLLEELTNGQQPYGFSPSEDPTDLLAIQLDLISLLEQYAN
jgi:hypothetical protein